MAAKELYLKNCPFCGGEAKLELGVNSIGVKIGHAECTKCHAEGSGFSEYHEDWIDKIVDAWNNRKSDTLFVLKVQMKYEDYWEIVGIFFEESIEEAKKVYMSKMSNISKDNFTFETETYVLNKVY